MNVSPVIFRPGRESALCLTVLLSTLFTLSTLTAKKVRVCFTERFSYPPSGMTDHKTL